MHPECREHLYWRCFSFCPRYCCRGKQRNHLRLFFRATANLRRKRVARNYCRRFVRGRRRSARRWGAGKCARPLPVLGGMASPANGRPTASRLGEDAVLSTVGCEAHEEDFGGTALLTRNVQGGRWSGTRPGWILRSATRFLSGTRGKFSSVLVGTATNSGMYRPPSISKIF